MQTGRVLPCPEGVEFVGGDDDHGVFAVHCDPLRLPSRGPATSSLNLALASPNFQPEVGRGPICLA